MLYKVHWPQGSGPKSHSQFATWDGKVVEATPVLKRYVGYSIQSLISSLTSYGARIEIIKGSEKTKSF